MEPGECLYQNKVVTCENTEEKLDMVGRYQQGSFQEVALGLGGAS